MRIQCNEAEHSIKIQLLGKNCHCNVLFHKYDRYEFELFLSVCQWSNMAERFSGSDVLDFQICYSAMDGEQIYNAGKFEKKTRQGAKVWYPNIRLCKAPFLWRGKQLVFFCGPTCFGKDLAIGRGFFSYQKCLLQTEDDDGLKGSSGK